MGPNFDLSLCHQNAKSFGFINYIYENCINHRISTKEVQLADRKIDQLNVTHTHRGTAIQ